MKLLDTKITLFVNVVPDDSPDTSYLDQEEFKDRKFADAPDSLLEFAKRPDRSLQTGESTHEDSATIKRFVHYLQTCEPAIQGKMGDQTTFNTACVGRDFGLSEQLVADLMLEHFNERCEPRWETEQLCKKVEYAFRYANGVFTHCGIFVELELWNQKTGIRKTYKSPGLWGVESDCGNEYAYETAGAQLRELADNCPEICGLDIDEKKLVWKI